MVLNISVTEKTEARLREQASAAGTDLSAYAAQLIEQAAAQRAVDESLAPLRREFEASGTSDEQLVDQITSAQQAYRLERNQKNPG